MKMFHQYDSLGWVIFQLAVSFSTNFAQMLLYSVEEIAFSIPRLGENVLEYPTGRKLIFPTASTQRFFKRYFCTPEMTC